MTFLYTHTLKCTFIRSVILTFASSLRLSPLRLPSGIAHDGTTVTSQCCFSSLFSQFYPYSLLPTAPRSTSCMSKSTRFEPRAALIDLWTGLCLCSTFPLTAHRYSPCSRKASCLAQTPLYTTQWRTQPYRSPVACVSGYCQRIVLAVWHCSVGGVKRPPRLASRFWTQPVQVLQTCWKTGEQLLPFQLTPCAMSPLALLSEAGVFISLPCLFSAVF